MKGYGTGEIDRPSAKSLNAWVGHTAVAAGLAYMTASRIYAFPVDCRTSGGKCRPMWVGPAGFASEPAVSETAVAVTYVDGRVVLFEPSAS